MVVQRVFLLQPASLNKYLVVVFLSRLGKKKKKKESIVV